MIQIFDLAVLGPGSFISEHPLMVYPAVGAVTAAAVTYGGIAAYNRYLSGRQHLSANERDSHRPKSPEPGNSLSRNANDPVCDERMTALLDEWKTHSSTRGTPDRASNYPSISCLGAPMDSAGDESRREFFLRYHRPLSVLFDEKRWAETMDAAGTYGGDESAREYPVLSTVHHTDTGLAAVFTCGFPTSVEKWVEALPVIRFSLDAPDTEVSPKMSGGGQVVLCLHDVSRRDDDMREVDRHRGVPELRELSVDEESFYRTLLSGGQVPDGTRIPADAALTVLERLFGYEAASWALRSLPEEFPMEPGEFIGLCEDVATARKDPEQSRPLAGEVPVYDHPISLPVLLAGHGKPAELEGSMSFRKTPAELPGPERRDDTATTPPKTGNPPATPGRLDVDMMWGFSFPEDAPGKTPATTTSGAGGVSGDAPTGESPDFLRIPVDPAFIAGPVVNNPPPVDVEEVIDYSMPSGISGSKHGIPDVFVGPGEFADDYFTDDPADIMSSSSVDDAPLPADFGTGPLETHRFPTVELPELTEYGTAMFTEEELKNFGVTDDETDS